MSQQNPHDSEQKKTDSPNNENKKEDNKEDSKDNKEGGGASDSEAASSSSSINAIVTPSLVVVHPLVLLSVVDHYNRVAKDTKKRVVGILLGYSFKGTFDITNSYAVPFEEDEKNPDIWFLDHNYHENMWSMFKKVNARERVIGWYSTGPKIRGNDLAIHALVRRYSKHPVFVIIDINQKIGLPTKAYVTKQEANEDGTSSEKFQHLPSTIGALEAEEVGVEHLLRDVKDTNISTLATSINQKITGLKSLIERLEEMHQYLDEVVHSKLPINHTIINHMQEIFNLLPNLNDESLVAAFNVKTNDHMLAIYLSGLIRSVIALHNLINNKLENQDLYEEKKKTDKKEAEDKDKDKEKKRQ